MTVKMAELFKKRPGMPLDEFHDYWLSQHSKVVMGLQGIQRYVQNHPLPWSRENLDLPFDGIVEVWFESREIMHRNAESAYWAELVADEEKFIDRSDVTLLLADEHVVKEGATNLDGVKTMQPISWTPGNDGHVPPEGWMDEPSQRIAASPRVAQCAQNVLPSSAYKSGRRYTYDGLSICWFDQFDDFEAAFKSGEASRPFEQMSSAGPLVALREFVIKA